MTMVLKFKSALCDSFNAYLPPRHRVWKTVSMLIIQSILAQVSELTYNMRLPIVLK